MKDLFIEVLRDSATQWVLRDFMPRDIEPAPAIPGKASVFIGIRRAGKTTFMRQVALRLIERSECLLEQVVFINFSDERLSGVVASDLNFLIEAHYQLNPDLSKDLPLMFFLDEIQIVPEWELFVDRLLRNKKSRIFLSGSSAKLLSTDIATEMRGRAIALEVFPYSFKEIAKSKQIAGSGETAAERGALAHLVGQYMTGGGFPEVQGLSGPVARQILQGYLNLVLLKDVIERYNPRDPLAVRMLMRYALSSLSASVSFTKMSAKLRNFGIKSTPAEVSEYLGWFQDCYLFWLVPLFANSIHRQNTNPRKLYCVDNGFFSAGISGRSDCNGALLENLVFCALRHSGTVPCYYKTREGFEVDFIYKEDGSAEHKLTQVCFDLREGGTFQREMRALVSACRELGLRSGTIVSMDESRQILEDGVEIEVMPVHRFLLKV